MDLLTIYLLFFTALNILTVLTTVLFYRWRMKELRQQNKYFKGCVELYREVFKQDLPTNNNNNKGETKWNSQLES